MEKNRTKNKKTNETNSLSLSKKQNFFSRMTSFSAFYLLCIVIFFGAFWERTPYKLRDHICFLRTRSSLSLSRSLFTFKCKYKQHSFFSFYLRKEENDRWNTNMMQSNRVTVIITTNKRITISKRFFLEKKEECELFHIKVKFDLPKMAFRERERERNSKPSVFYFNGI